MTLFAFLKRSSDPKAETSQDIRRKQILLGVGVTLSVVIGVFVLQAGFKKATMPKQVAEKPRKAVIGDFVDDRDVWASRLEAQMEKMMGVADRFKAQNDLQEKRLKSLETALLASEKSRLQKPKETVSKQGEPVGKPMTDDVKTSSFSVTSPYGSVKGQPVGQSPTSHGFGQDQQAGKLRGPVTKIIHFSTTPTNPFHSVDDYVVSGTHARAVLTSGVVVSTAVQTQSNPQPIVLRLGDQGNLPRGFKSRLKDAVLIGSCYGDISSERAMCRIQTLSYVETSGAKAGQTVEKTVEGWVIGEDGAPGLRGRVVDKAGKVAREAMIAGMLSGLSSFFKNEARSSVFPTTPFGQTNALNGTDAVKTGLGNGASNALEKLAEFSIKRAEAMSPVLVVNPGRVVDVVFKSGFNLRPVANQTYHRVGAPSKGTD